METSRTGEYLRTRTWSWYVHPLWYSIITAFQQKYTCVEVPSSQATNTRLKQVTLCLQGLAHCFQKSEEGKLTDCFVLEPISANALEARPTLWPQTTHILLHSFSALSSCSEGPV